MGLNLGKYRTPGTVRTATDGVKSTYGVTPQPLSDLVTLYFWVQTKSARENLRDGLLEGTASHVLTTPYPGSTLAGQIVRPCEVVIDSRTFKVIAPVVNPGVMNEEMQFICEEAHA